MLDKYSQAEKTLEEKPYLLKENSVRLSKILNLPIGDIYRLRGEIKIKRMEILIDKTVNIVNDISESIEKVNNDKGTLESTVEVGFKPRDDKELAKLHKIDLKKYKISNYWSKLKSNGKFTSSVLCTIKKSKDYTQKDFEEFLKTYRPIHVWDETQPLQNTALDTVDIELSIADFHLGKKAIVVETIEEKKVLYMNTVRELVSNVSNSYNIDTIVFPISNDFFHTDNYQNQTTNLTPQDVLVNFDEEYEEGFDLLVSVITFLSGKCKNLNVVLVQGNHDRTKSFYLAHALEVFFSKTPGIHFDRTHSVTKAIIVGTTFIGYHHGNGCKLDELPLLFATSPEYSLQFGRAKYREIHTGDKHHYLTKEVKGVRIQQMPSLSGTDRWHEDNNYVNSIRAGMVLIYHPEKGKIGEFESRI